MASLQGLPTLPRSLHGLLQGGSAHWKETERILQIRASIQQDIIETQSRQWGGGGSLTNGDSSGGSPAVSRRTTVASLQATLAQLRREMVSLRQVDMSLLCQLWTLNESIQEYKHLVGDRMSETNSECSNYSLENGLDAIPSIEEEHDADLLGSSLDESSSERIFEDLGMASVQERRPRASLTPSVKSQRSRTPPKQRPRVPPPAAPRPPDSPTPPPRGVRTPPTHRAAPPQLPHVPPPAGRAPPLPTMPPPSLSRTPSLVSMTMPAPRTPPQLPVNRTPPPRSNCSTPPLPHAPPPVHRTPPTKRLPHVQSVGPQAPPRRSRNTPPRNSQSSPSLSQRSSFSTCSNRSSAYGSDC